MSQSTQKPYISDSQMPGAEVLILSNNRAFIKHHRAILLSIGFVPITVNALEAALAIMHLIVIELVIVDEEAGPLEAQKVLKRARDDGRDVPVLVVSQSPNAELQHQAMELGAVGYLDRPAFQDDVVRALLVHCSRRNNRLWGAQQN